MGAYRLASHSQKHEVFCSFRSSSLLCGWIPLCFSSLLCCWIPLCSWLLSLCCPRCHCCCHPCLLCWCLCASLCLCSLCSGKPVPCPGGGWKHLWWCHWRILLC